MEPTNKTADLSALRIPRDAAPERGRWVVPALSTLVVLAVAGALVWARTAGVLALSAPEVATTRVALVTPVQASTVLTASGYIVA